MVMLLREPARPAAVRAHRRAPWLAVGAVCLGAFMGQLDASIVTLAFPALQRGFGASLAQVQWVSLGYLVTVTALVVPVGRWSDRAGRKLVYLYGFAVFGGASAACGLAPTLAALVALRVAQAAGAAMLQANSVALVSTSAPRAARRAALAAQAGAQAIGLAAGPVVGGALVAAAGWRWIFFVNVPVGLLAIAAGWCLLPRTRRRQRPGGGDPVGAALLGCAAAGSLVVVSALSGLGVAVPAVIAIAALSGAAWAFLPRWERRAAAPLIDLPMLAAGAGPALAGALCAYLVLFGPLVLVPQLLAGRGSGVLGAGLIVAALPAGFGGMALAAERLLPAGWDNGRRCVAGGLLAACAVASLAARGPDPLTALSLLLTGAGLGAYIPANNVAVMAAVPDERAGRAGGMVNLARGMGTAFGVAVVTLALRAGSRLLGPAGGPDLAAGTLAVVALAAVLAAALAAGRGDRADRGGRAPAVNGGRAAGAGTAGAGTAGAGAAGAGAAGAGAAAAARALLAVAVLRASRFLIALAAGDGQVAGGAPGWAHLADDEDDLRQTVVASPPSTGITAPVT